MRRVMRALASLTGEPFTRIFFHIFLLRTSESKITYVGSGCPGSEAGR